MILYLPMTLLLVCAGLVVQELVPQTIFGGHFLVFLSLFYCLAVSVPYSWMLLLSALAGLLWDLRYLEVVPWESGGDLFFGSSVLLFALTGSFMYGVRPQAQKNRTLVPVLMVVPSVLGFQLLGYLFLTFLRGGFDFPGKLFWHMTRTALVSSLSAPVWFWLLRRLKKWTRADDNWQNLDEVY